MASTKTESVKSPKVDVRQAAANAANYFRKLFPEVSNYSLEEVELSEDEKFWLITLGFEWQKPDLASQYSSGILREVFNPPKTKYKVFKVDVRTGEVQSMKIRLLAA